MQQPLLYSASLLHVLQCGFCRGKNPLDRVSSTGSPSLLQMCTAEPGSHRAERTGQTGMRCGGEEEECALLGEAGDAGSWMGERRSYLWEVCVNLVNIPTPKSSQMCGTSVSYRRQDEAQVV